MFLSFRIILNVFFKPLHIHSLNNLSNSVTFKLLFAAWFSVFKSNPVPNWIWLRVVFRPVTGSGLNGVVHWSRKRLWRVSSLRCGCIPERWLLLEASWCWPAGRGRCTDRNLAADPCSQPDRCSWESTSSAWSVPSTVSNSHLYGAIF